jgi:hypothetical protein
MVKWPQTPLLRGMSSFTVEFPDAVSAVAVASNTVCSCHCLLSIDDVGVAIAASSAVVAMAPAVVVVVVIYVVQISPKALAEAADLILPKQMLYFKFCQKRWPRMLIE